MAGRGGRINIGARPLEERFSTTSVVSGDEGAPRDPGPPCLSVRHILSAEVEVELRSRPLPLGPQTPETVRIVEDQDGDRGVRTAQDRLNRARSRPSKRPFGDDDVFFSEDSATPSKGASTSACL